MRQNLIALAGLSHSGKDLLFGQVMKLGKNEPNLKIVQNVVYYDWLTSAIKKGTNSYSEKLLSVVREKLVRKLNTLVYIHDITYQRLDDTSTDFQEIVSHIKSINPNFNVVVLLNRGHLIPNEVERNKIKENVVKLLQQIHPHDIQSYIVSLKGVDEQRRTNLIFTQVINRAADFEKQMEELLLNSQFKLDESKKEQIQSFLKKKMEKIGFAGAYLLSSGHEILFAFGKSKSWQEKLGPQIIRMFAQNEAFDLAPKVRTNILRIEDFLMVTHAISPEIKLILIGREASFRLNLEAYSNIDQSCAQISSEILPKIN